MCPNHFTHESKSEDYGPICKSTHRKYRTFIAACNMDHFLSASPRLSFLHFEMVALCGVSHRIFPSKREVVLCSKFTILQVVTQRKKASMKSTMEGVIYTKHHRLMAFAAMISSLILSIAETSTT